MLGIQNPQSKLEIVKELMLHGNKTARNYEFYFINLSYKD